MADPMLSDLQHVLRAVSFAARAHRHQFRKDGETPYVSHVFRVAAILRNLFLIADPQILTTALLHDTIEDTQSDFDDILAEFGSPVADWVALLTKDKRLEHDAREANYESQLIQAPWQVQICKLADLLDNLIDSKSLSLQKQEADRTRTLRFLNHFRPQPRSEVQQAISVVHAYLDSTS